MAAQFATIAEFYAFIGQAVPTDPAPVALAWNAALQRASNDIRSAVRLARVTYDGDFPASTAIREAFRDATCAHLEWAGGSGSGVTDVDFTGRADEFDSVSLIGVQFSRRVNGGAVSSDLGRGRISPEARAYLLNAGIFSTAVSH